MNRKSVLTNNRAVSRGRHARENFPDADLGEAPRHQGMVGQVTSIVISKGYGFLTAAGISYFFHRNDFVRAADFDAVGVGMHLTFEPRQRAVKGPRAERLELA